MDKLYKQINRVKFLMEDHKKIGDELEGIGNYLITSDYNIVNKKTLPLELLNIHDSATVSKYWDDTLEFMHFVKKELDKNKKLFSTQKYVSKTFIDSITDKVYNKKFEIDGFFTGIYITYENRTFNLFIHEDLYDFLDIFDLFCICIFPIL